MRDSSSKPKMRRPDIVGPSTYIRRRVKTFSDAVQNQASTSSERDDVGPYRSTSSSRPTSGSSRASRAEVLGRHNAYYATA